MLLPLDFEGILHPKHSMLYQPGASRLTVMGRLRPGETVRKAQANLSAIDRQITEAADPSHNFLTTGFFGTSGWVWNPAAADARGCAGNMRSRWSHSKFSAG